MKFKIESCNPILTLMEERLKLVKDASSELIDATNFKIMVGSL